MRIAVFTFLLLLAVTASGYSDTDNRIVVRPAGSDMIDAGPKEVVTTMFRVTNNGDPLELEADLKLPEGWKLITQDVPFTIESGASEIKMVSLFIPQKTLAGSYRVTYRVFARARPELSDEFSIQVNVLPVSDLNVILVEAPNRVIAGEAYTARFLITNLSNINEEIILKLDSSHGFRAVLAEKDCFLKSGESRPVDVAVKTDPEAAGNVFHVLKMSAVLKAASARKASASAQVEVISRVMGKADRYTLLPLSVSLNFAGQSYQKTVAGFQGDISGGGPIDENMRHLLYFRMRSPDIYEKSILAEHDENYVYYQSDKIRTHVGDKVYKLSSLTENARFGRGAEAELRYKSWTAGGFYQKSRYLNPTREEVAGFIRYGQEKHRFGLNVLHKQMREGYADLFSLEAHLDWNLMRIDLESAYSFHEGRDGYGLKMLVSGSTNRIKYYANWTYASPEFAGHYHNTNYLTANISFKVASAFRLFAGARQEKQNFDVDTTLYTAPFMTYYNAGAQFRIRKGSSLSLEWIQRSREDRLDNSKFNYRDNVIKLQVSQHFPKTAVNIGVEKGRTDNFLADFTSGMSRYSASLFYYPLTGQSIGGYMYYDDNTHVSNERQRRFTVGVNMNFRFSRRTAFMLNFQNNYALEEYYRDRNIFEARLIHTLPWKHKITARARVTLLRNSENINETAFVFKYSMPFGIPVAKKRSIGSIQGKVFDHETGIGLQDILLRLNGITAVTNKHGEFVFPSLVPGDYHLIVDRTNIGFERVVYHRIPAECTIIGGETQTINFSVGEAATLKGSVILYGPDEVGKDFGEETRSRIASVYSDSRKNSRNEPLYGLRNMLIEIENEETLRQLTDKDGTFVFNELRPGNWKVRVYGNLPDYHQFESRETEIKIENGKENKVEFRVFPKERRIRIQGGGSIQETDAKIESGKGGQNRVDRTESRSAVRESDSSFDRPEGQKKASENDFTVTEEPLALNMQSYTLQESIFYAAEPYVKGNFEDILLQIPERNRERSTDPEEFIASITSIRKAMENQSKMLSNLIKRKSKQQKVKTSAGSYPRTLGPPPADVHNSETDEYVINYQKGLELYYERKYEESIEIFTRLLDQSKSEQLTSNCHFWIGECRFSMGNYRGAMRAFSEVLALKTSRKYQDARKQIYLCQLYMEGLDALSLPDAEGNPIGSWFNSVPLKQ